MAIGQNRAFAVDDDSGSCCFRLLVAEFGLYEDNASGLSFCGWLGVELPLFGGRSTFWPNGQSVVLGRVRCRVLRLILHSRTGSQ